MTIRITTASSARDTRWTPRDVEWEGFAAELAAHRRTWETCAQYDAMDKDRRAQCKDGRAYVGGDVVGGRRKKDAVTCRTLITLDADSVEGMAAEDVAARVAAAFPGNAAVVYSSHSHRAESPRLRIVLPLRRPIPPDLYEPAARMAAKLVGIDMMDATTYQAERCMYYPTCSKDAEPFAWRQEGEPVDALDLLAPYAGRHADPSLWPRSAREGAAPAQAERRPGSAVANPLGKEGIVGAFCRAHYPIDEAMAELIPGVYEPCPRLGRGRYTYSGGHTSGGAVAAPWTGKDGEPPTEGNALLYSHHESDPARGASNIYDLVRVHRFGGDEAAMLAFAEADAATAALMEREASDTAGRLAAADLEGWEPAPPPAKPRPRSRRKAGATDDPNLIGNIAAMMDGDAELAGLLGYDDFAGRLAILRDLPWRPGSAGTSWTDADESQLLLRLEAKGATKAENARHALRVCADARRFHPVRDYLASLPAWDGTPRLSRLLVDYLGAEDTLLNREMPRLHLAAAVARVMRPGCKYDHILLLKGPQGSGKSSVPRILGGAWFSDSVGFGDLRRTTEQLQGMWLLEFGELTGYGKQEGEAIKQFISSPCDDFRPAYGRNVERRPRQCVFWATSNEDTPLKDASGNRRWVPVSVSPELRRYGSVAEAMAALERDRDQIWAEALAAYRSDYEGRPLMLSAEAEAEAREAQARANELADDPLLPELRRFLDLPLPYSWDGMPLASRRAFLADPDGSAEVAARQPRQRVCAAEFLREQLRREPGERDYRMLTRRVNALMDAMPGWHNVSSTRHAEQLYGRQRGYVRDGCDVEDKEPTLEDIC